jgi:hypothetical protein
VSGFVKLLTGVIEFGANAEGQPVLAAMTALPEILAYRTRQPPASLGRVSKVGKSHSLMAAMQTVAS